MGNGSGGPQMSQAIAHRPEQLGALDGHHALDLTADAHRRPIVVVLGMPRSGTSLCSHALSVLGADMTDPIERQPTNADRYWERMELRAFHNQILDVFGRAYDSPAHDLPLPIAWWTDPQVQAIRQEIVAFLRRRIPEGGLFGFKDPRAARLLPVWHQVFEELKLAPKFVLCLRNPAQVTRSLSARDGLDLDIGEYRWFSYTAEALASLQDWKVCTIEYEDWFGDVSINLRKLMRFLDLSWKHPQASLRAAISHIVDPRLRHDSPSMIEPRQPLVRSLYAMVRSLNEDAAAERIGALIDQFAAYQQLCFPLCQEFDHASECAAGLPERERELAALRCEVEGLRTERDTALAEARQSAAREAEAEARLAAAAVELTARGMALAGAEQELCGAAARLGGMEARLAAMETEMAIEKHRGDALSGSLVAAQADLAAERAERDRAEQIAAELEEIAEAAQAAVDGLRTRLAKMEQETAESAALVEGERDRTTEERDRIAAERDRIAAERDCLKAESEQWFDAAIFVTTEPVIRARPARCWRIGRHVLQLTRLRGRGSLMQQADAARAGRRWARAARFYLDALRHAPKWSAVWVQLGHALKEAGRRAEAEFAYRRAADLDRTSLDAFVALGQLLRERGKDTEAAAIYRRAAALDPPAELRVFLSGELAALDGQTESPL